MLPVTLRRAVEGFADRIQDFPSTAHLYFLDRRLRVFLRAHLVDRRSPHIWLDHYLSAYPDDVNRAEYLVVAKAGSRDTTDLYLVSSRSHEIYVLHVTPKGRKVWHEARESRITEVLRAHMNNRIEGNE